MTQTSGLFIYNFVLGVIDHNLFNVDNWEFGIYVHHNSWNNRGDFGDESFADDAYLGTSKAIFVEDNTFTTSAFSAAIDGWNGSHVVFRHNKSINALFANHGTESPGRWRSQRTFEVYDNVIEYNNPSVWDTVIGMRGGTGVVFNNTATASNGAYLTHVVELAVFRVSDRQRDFYPWHWCDGRNIWDGNQDATGYPCLDQPGRGKGALLSGAEPTPVGWPHQALEPVYAWNNILNGNPTRVVSTSPSVIAEGRDFYNDVKPGYAPYTYPHPLVTGGTVPSTSTPAAPQNLRIVGGQ
jgi:hypothetical protein